MEGGGRGGREENGGKVGGVLEIGVTNCMSCVSGAFLGKKWLKERLARGMFQTEVGFLHDFCYPKQGYKMSLSMSYKIMY